MSCLLRIPLLLNPDLLGEYPVNSLCAGMVDGPGLSCITALKRVVSRSVAKTEAILSPSLVSQPHPCQLFISFVQAHTQSIVIRFPG